MLPLRFPWAWWGLGSLLLAAVVIGSLVPAGGIPPLPIRDKLLHAGAYGLLMLWFAGLYPRSRHWLIALLLFALGLGLDWLQAATATRSFELADVAANAGGILLAFVLAWWFFGGWCRRLEQWFFA